MTEMASGNDLVSCSPMISLATSDAVDRRAIEIQKRDTLASIPLPERCGALPAHDAARAIMYTRLKHIDIPLYKNVPVPETSAALRLVLQITAIQQNQRRDTYINAVNSEA